MPALAMQGLFLRLAQGAPAVALRHINGGLRAWEPLRTTTEEGTHCGGGVFRARPWCSRTSDGGDSLFVAEPQRHSKRRQKRDSPSARVRRAGLAESGCPAGQWPICYFRLRMAPPKRVRSAVHGLAVLAALAMQLLGSSEGKASF